MAWTVELSLSHVIEMAGGNSGNEEEDGDRRARVEDDTDNMGHATSTRCDGAGQLPCGRAGGLSWPTAPGGWSGEQRSPRPGQGWILERVGARCGENYLKVSVFHARVHMPAILLHLTPPFEPQMISFEVIS